MSIAKNLRNLNKKDEYYTPDFAIYPLLKYIKPKSYIWCPFDLESSEYVKIFKEEGHKVLYTHINMGYDFLKYTPDDIDKVDYIISNPPYSLKEKILYKLYKLNKPFAMLMSSLILDYVCIYNILEENNFDIELLFFDKRISYDGNTSSFKSIYFCRKFLGEKLKFERINFRLGEGFKKSSMYSNEIEDKYLF